jgi:hypothetical protein
MPVVKKKYSLSSLLAQVTEKNKHSEAQTANPVG